MNDTHDTLLSAEQVREALGKLNMAQLGELSEKSGVPMPTLYKIRQGETENPGIETVRKFMPHIPKAANPAVA